jgi:hypothetical protein
MSWRRPRPPDDSLLAAAAAARWCAWHMAVEAAELRKTLEALPEDRWRLRTRLVAAIQYRQRWANCCLSLADAVDPGATAHTLDASGRE